MTDKIKKFKAYVEIENLNMEDLEYVEIEEIFCLEDMVITVWN